MLRDAPTLCGFRSFWWWADIYFGWRCAGRREERGAKVGEDQWRHGKATRMAWLFQQSLLYQRYHELTWHLILHDFLQSYNTFTWFQTHIWSILGRESHVPDSPSFCTKAKNKSDNDITARTTRITNIPSRYLVASWMFHLHFLSLRLSSSSLRHAQAPERASVQRNLCPYSKRWLRIRFYSFKYTYSL